MQRIETQLATDPAMSHEFALLRDQIEDALERVRHTRPDFGGSALAPSSEYAAPPIAGTGKAATPRHRQRAAAPEIVQWWANQDERLAASARCAPGLPPLHYCQTRPRQFPQSALELARLVRESA